MLDLWQRERLGMVHEEGHFEEGAFLLSNK